jgi:hypothetical protein
VEWRWQKLTAVPHTAHRIWHFSTRRSRRCDRGGNWTLGTSSDTCRVTQLVQFTPAPGTFAGLGLTDKIGNPAHAEPGLAVMQIKYSDGSRGFLVLSCNLNGTSPAVFEGTTASIGIVDYWNRANNPAVLHVKHGANKI